MAGKQKRFREEVNRLRAAERRFALCMDQILPGATVIWPHGTLLRFGMVLRVGNSGTRCQIVSTVGTKYWIHTRQITEVE